LGNDLLTIGGTVSGCPLFKLGLLVLVPQGRLLLSFLLKSINKILVLPSDKVAKVTKNAEPPVLLDPQVLQGLGNDLPLLLAVGVWDSLEALQSACK